MTELVDYAERMTRAAIGDLPDGTYDFLDHIDDDGIDVGRPIPLKVTITKTGDRIAVDWTGSSPQVKGAIKEGVGQATGDAKTEASGKADKAEGKVQNAVGSAKDAVKDKLSR